MATPHLIGQAPGNTPASLKGPRTRRRALPEDLLRDASRRLGIIALLAAVLWTLGTGLSHWAAALINPDDPAWRQLIFSDWVAVAAVILSGALYFYTRRSQRNPELILDLGLWYMVFTGLAVGIISHAGDTIPDTWQIMPMITWSGVVTLISAAILPAPPSKTALAAFVTVTMNPVGMLLGKARGGWDYGPASNILLMHYPDYLLAGVSVVISNVVTKLGHQVTRAREMGSYQLGELLGQGGMGQVYRATHRMLARPAAIKLIRPETLGTGQLRDLAVKRFRREAEVAASLRSPHTVELYDFGVTEDETLYFVMELLEGMTLESLVHDYGPVPAERVIYLTRQICESLEEAHTRGLVHRDVKPANIHVGRVGLHCDFVKVLDFGLVKSVKGPQAENTLATGLGGTPGTPDYMAPEMTLGETVDGRADLYALGCVAYFMLTGKPVFEATNVFHAIARHLNDVPEPPSQRSSLPIPAGLEQLVLALLAKRPDQRPQTAAEVSRLLGKVEAQPWGEDEAAIWWNALPPKPGAPAARIGQMEDSSVS